MFQVLGFSVRFDEFKFNILHHFCSYQINEWNFSS